MKNLILLTFLLWSNLTFAYKQFNDITIGDPKRTDTSAVFEAYSTTKGMLPPRMTEAQRDAIVSPANGLFLYNLDSRSLEVYSASSTSWSVVGPQSRQQTYDFSITGVLELDNISSGISINNASTTPVTGNLFEVKAASGTPEYYFEVDTAGASTSKLLVDNTTRIDGSKIDLVGSSSTILLDGNGITLDGATTSTILEVVSTTKGSIPCPSMTGAERDAIGTPTSGMCVFNLDTARENFYTGASWESVLPILNGGTATSTALSNDRLMVSSGGAIVEQAAMIDGQLVIGSSGAAPVLSSLTGTANQINVASGSGTITLSTPQDIHTSATPTFSGIILNDLAFSDGINVATTDVDPTVVSINSATGSLLINQDTGTMYTKLDDGSTTNWATFKTSSSAFSVSTVSTSSTISNGINVVFADTTLADLTLTLPDAASNSGQHLAFVNIGSGTGTATLLGAGGDLIDTSATTTLEMAPQSRQLVSDGTGWRTISNPASFNIFYASIQNNGTCTVLSQKPVSFIQSCTRTSLSRTTLVYHPGFFSTAPSPVPAATDADDAHAQAISYFLPTSTGVNFRTMDIGNLAVTYQDSDFNVIFFRNTTDFRGL